MTDLGTCATNRDLSWDVYREAANGHATRAPERELAAAITACHSCPALTWCRTQTPVPSMIIAGTIYDHAGNPWHSAATFTRRTKKIPEPAACKDDAGTPEGVNAHRRQGERNCEPCASWKRNHQRRSERCSRGHEFGPERDAWGRRMCRRCEEDRAAKDREATPIQVLTTAHTTRVKLAARGIPVPADVLELARQYNRVKARERRIRERAEAASGAGFLLTGEETAA